MASDLGSSSLANLFSASFRRRREVTEGSQRGKTTALIVCANQRKAYPIIRSLKKMKYLTIGAFHVWRSPLFSRYLDRRYKIANPYEDEKAYITHIRQLMDQYDPVVVPVGFIDAMLLSNYRTSLGKKGIVLAPNHVAIRKAADKATLEQLCHATGVKYPATKKIDKRSWKKVVKELGLPLVVKGTSDAAQPQYIFHATDLEQIITSRTGSLIAQQFIPGSGAGYFSVSQSGHILAEYVHRRVVETKPSGGPSLVACHDHVPTLYELGQKITSSLNWSGVLMVEFRKHEETGEFYLIEVNPKFWGSLELATAWGLDFPQYLLHSQEYAWTPFPEAPEYPIFHKPGTRGCFSWLLPGFSAYFRTNPQVWLRMLWYAFRRKQRTDIHLRDPPELMYGMISRFLNILRPQAGYSKKILRARYKHTIHVLQQRLFHEPIRALIFDLDGTLANLKVNWSEVRQMLRLQGLFDPQEASVMINLYRAQHQDPDRFLKISHIVETYEEQAAAKLPKDKALAQGFQALHQYKIKTAIISRQTSRNIRTAITCLGLEGTIDFIIGREQGMQRTHQATRALQALQTTPINACLIGDTLTDIVTAASLQMKPIAITTNPYRFQQFTELGVPCFTKVSDFLRIIKKRYRK
ncbi:MAG: HAD hydrolase-like protein [Promethearchaeota archaeon]